MFYRDGIAEESGDAVYPVVVASLSIIFVLVVEFLFCWWVFGLELVADRHVVIASIKIFTSYRLHIIIDEAEVVFSLVWYQIFLLHFEVSRYKLV